MVTASQNIGLIGYVKVGNAASEIGGGVEPNNATSPMNEPLFGGSRSIYTFPKCYDRDLSCSRAAYVVHWFT
jgi:hypothetical protein